MKVRILSILDSEQQLVCVGTEVGELIGYWKGHHLTERALGDSFSIEIDINIILTVKKNLFVTAEKVFNSNISNQNVVLTGQIEDLDDDNVITFRLAKDCLILIEVESTEALTVGMWIRLEVTTKLLTFHPF